MLDQDCDRCFSVSRRSGGAVRLFRIGTIKKQADSQPRRGRKVEFFPMAYVPKHSAGLRLFVTLGCVLAIASSSWALIANRARDTERSAQSNPAANAPALPEGRDAGGRDLEVAPLHPIEVNPVLPPPAPVEPPKAKSKPAAKPKAQPAPRTAAVPADPPPGSSPSFPVAAGVYRGMGAWVDIFDYHTRAEVTAGPMLDNMSRRGVRTVFLQSSRFKQPEDILNPEKVGIFIDEAHARGIAVVAWYVPGFGHLDRDIRSSMAAIEFKSSTGHSFDGFAPDIETGDDLIGGDRARFNAGIAEYSRRLRERAGGRVLGAIVVDAKNNERAPAKWAGFPWPEIGRYYDVVLPMAYWSVTKRGGCGAEYDTAQYMREVYDKTQALMQIHRPLNIIGGIGNCISHSETAHMVDALLEKGAIGGGLYDFETQESNGARDGIWQELTRLNR